MKVYMVAHLGTNVPEGIFSTWYLASCYLDAMLDHLEKTLHTRAMDDEFYIEEIELDPSFTNTRKEG